MTLTSQPIYRSHPGHSSPRTITTMQTFGLTEDDLHRRLLCRQCRIEVQPGQIVYITGPSGSGKSLLLKSFYQNLDAKSCMWLDEVTLHSNKMLVDCFASDIATTLRQLAGLGLADAFSLLTPPAYLSTGQQTRYRMAQLMRTECRYLFADEFCSHCDRITAATCAYHVRRAITHSDRICLFAGHREEILADLRPDILIVQKLSGSRRILYRHPHQSPIEYIRKRPFSRYALQMEGCNEND